MFDKIHQWSHQGEGFSLVIQHCECNYCHWAIINNAVNLKITKMTILSPLNSLGTHVKIIWLYIHEGLFLGAWGKGSNIWIGRRAGDTIQAMILLRLPRLSPLPPAGCQHPSDVRGHKWKMAKSPSSWVPKWLCGSRAAWTWTRLGLFIWAEHKLLYEQ